MKVYYIFKIKKPFLLLYRDIPYVLYTILRNLYYSDKESVEYGRHICNQLIDSFNKDEMDKNIYIKMHQDIPYIKKKDTHMIHNLYKDELSKLNIHNFFIRLELNQDFSGFYSYLNDYDKDLFVCCFRYVDYFFLEDYQKNNL